MVLGLVAMLSLGAVAVVPGTAAATQGETYEPGQTTPEEYTVWVVNSTDDTVEEVFNLTEDGSHLNVTQNGVDSGVDIFDRRNTSALITAAADSATAENSVLVAGPGVYNVSEHSGEWWTGPPNATTDSDANVTRLVADGENAEGETVLRAAAGKPSTLLVVDNPNADALEVGNISFEAAHAAEQAVWVGAIGADATLDLRSVDINATNQSALWIDAQFESFTVADSTIRYSGDSGLGVDWTADVNLTVTGSTIANSGFHGIQLRGANDSYLRDNTLEDNGLEGVRVVQGDRTTLVNNTIRNNGNWGMYVYDSENANLTGNAVTGNQNDGVQFQLTNESDLVDNALTDNGEFGIALIDADDNTLTNNAVSGNDGWNVGGAVRIDGESTGNVVDALNVGASTAPDTTVSFEARDVMLRDARDPSSLPESLSGSLASTGRYLDALVNPNGYLDVTMHYEEDDVSDLDESAVAMWENPYLDRWRKLFDASVDTGANTVTYNFTGGANGVNPTVGVFEDDTGTLNGTVSDQSGIGINGQIFIQDRGGQFRTFDDRLPNGQYRLAVPAGEYTLFADADGNTTASQDGVVVDAGEVVTVDLTLPAAAYIEGYVDVSGGNLQGSEAVVVNSGGTFHFNQTQADGKYRLEVPSGTHNVVGFDEANQRMGQNTSVAVSAGETRTDVNVTIATAQVTNTNLSVVEGTGDEDLSDLQVQTQVAPPVFMGVAIENTTTGGNPPLPDDLRSAGISDSTVFQIELTVDGINPDALLWGANDVEWETEPNAAGTGTNITINASPVHLAGVPGGNISGTSAVAGPIPPGEDINQIEWPTGANDTAQTNLNWNKTLYVMMMDTVLMPPDIQDQFQNVTVTTNAQLFSTPELDTENERLRVYAAGPGERPDGTQHTGFYRAFVPDRVLDDWGVDDPESELTAFVRGDDPDNFNVVETDDGPRGASGAWVHITNLHYSDGFIDVEPAESDGSGGSTSSGSSTGSYSSGSDSTSTPTPTPTPTSTESDTSTPTPTAEPTPTESNGEETTAATPTDTPTMAATTTPTATEAPGQPGFGVVAVTVALLAGALLLHRRR